MVATLVTFDCCAVPYKTHNFRVGYDDDELLLGVTVILLV